MTRKTKSECGTFTCSVHAFLSFVFEYNKASNTMASDSTIHCYH